MDNDSNIESGGGEQLSVDVNLSDLVSESSVLPPRDKGINLDDREIDQFSQENCGANASIYVNNAGNTSQQDLLVESSSPGCETKKQVKNSYNLGLYHAPSQDSQCQLLDKHAFDTDVIVPGELSSLSSEGPRASPCKDHIFSNIITSCAQDILPSLHLTVHELPGINPKKGKDQKYSAFQNQSGQDIEVSDVDVSIGSLIRESMLVVCNLESDSVDTLSFIDAQSAFINQVSDNNEYLSQSCSTSPSYAEWVSLTQTCHDCHDLCSPEKDCFHDCTVKSPPMNKTEPVNSKFEVVGSRKMITMAKKRLTRMPFRRKTVTPIGSKHYDHGMRSQKKQVMVNQCCKASRKLSGPRVSQTLLALRHGIDRQEASKSVAPRLSQCPIEPVKYKINNTLHSKSSSLPQTSKVSDENVVQEKSPQTEETNNDGMSQAEAISSSQFSNRVKAGVNRIDRSFSHVYPTISGSGNVGNINASQPLPMCLSAINSFLHSSSTENATAVSHSRVENDIAQKGWSLLLEQAKLRRMKFI